MENLGVVSLKNRRLLNVFSTCGRSSEAIPPKEKVSTLWNVNKEENQGCKFFKFSSWFCPESFYRTRNVGLSNCFLVDCADSIVLQQFLYFLIPNNVWSVFIGITWGDVSCEVSEKNENRKPIIVSIMKGSLVSFCQV